MKKRSFFYISVFLFTAMCFYMTSCINNPEAEGRASNFHFINDEKIGFDWFGDFDSSYINDVSVYDSAGTLRGGKSSVTTESIFLTGTIKLNCTVHSGWYVKISVRNDSTTTIYYN